MKTNSILIVGCGDIGSRVGRRLLETGWAVTGVRRDPTQLPAGFIGMEADYSCEGELDGIGELAPDYVLATFSPSERSVAGYQQGFVGGTRNLLAGLGAHRPRAILWVSSTRVYGERDGAWVKEDSELATDDPRAAALILAEQTLLNSPHRGTVIRFGGIYGAAGGRLIQRVQRGDMSPVAPVRYSNRIHRDDCAGFLCHLIGLAQEGAKLAAVYNGVDDLPAPQSEVEKWLAERLGASASAAVEAPQGTTKANSAGHKRCSNHLLRQSGYELMYPDFRSGYAAVLALESST